MTPTIWLNFFISFTMVVLTILAFFIAYVQQDGMFLLAATSFCGIGVVNAQLGIVLVKSRNNDTPAVPTK